MRRIHRTKKDKKIATGILVILIIFLAAYIHFYPDADTSPKASATEKIQTIKTAEVPQKVEFYSTTETNTETNNETNTEINNEINTEMNSETSTANNAEIINESDNITDDKTSALMTSQVTGTGFSITATGKAEGLIEKMSLKEKIYQMIVVRPEAITGVSTVTAAGDTTKTALQNYPVGGIIYSKQNMLSKEQLRTMIANTQSFTKIPLFIATDEEGGIVNRLMDSVGTTRIDSMYSYKDDGIDTAKSNAATIGYDMKSLGFNLDFAPVADVWSNEYNSVIGKRAYSDNFEDAAKLVGAAVQGFHESGVLTTLKHFPGHGDTAEDTHTSTAYVRRSEEKLRQNEFLPFEAGIQAGSELVMIGHMIVEDIDDTVPASLSEKVVTETLKNELRFEGLAITDSLEMAAISDRYTAAEAAVRAVKAGNDLLLEPANLDEAVAGILEAVNKGEISEAEISDHVLHILNVKEYAGVL